MLNRTNVSPAFGKLVINVSQTLASTLVPVYKERYERVAWKFLIPTSLSESIHIIRKLGELSSSEHMFVQF